MCKTTYRSSGLSSAAHLLIIGFALSYSSASSAQQSGSTTGSSGQSIPPQVVLEYATIGGMALSIPVLGLDRAGAGGGNQVATNRQVGDRNTSVISQSGSGNNATIRISGDDNRASIQQSGRNNVGQGILTGTEITFNLLQTGVGNRADVSMSTDAAQPGLGVTILQRGDNNALTASVPGSGTVSVTQVGGAMADVTQSGAAKNVTIRQFAR